MSNLLIKPKLTTAEIRQENLKFYNEIKHGGPVAEKTASNFLNDSVILKALREDGIFRRAINVISLGNMDLDFDPYYPDQPVKFEPVEDLIETYLVHSTDWFQPTQDLWYNSKYFKIRFAPMVSRMLRMDEGQILATKYPIRQMVEGIMKNDFRAREDYTFIDQIERCCARSGNIFMSTNSYMKKEDIGNIARIFSRNKLSMCQLIVNEATMYDIYNWENSEVGSFATDKILENGIMGEGLRFKQYLGQKWIVTNNLDIVPEGVIYATVPQSMLGAFYELLSPEAYVEYKRHVLSISSRQIVGSGIANIYGVAKIMLGSSN